jgi:hypothetical protein
MGNIISLTFVVYLACLPIAAHSSKIYQTGWPNYQYGGYNTLHITTSYYPRIGLVYLYLGYAMPNHKGGMSACAPELCKRINILSHLLLLVVQWARVSINDA